jgi:hypothetical protein
LDSSALGRDSERESTSLQGRGAEMGDVFSQFKREEQCEGDVLVHAGM